MVTPSIHEQCWEPMTSLEDIRKCIRNGHHVMIIMRGIPGSGKSYLASDLVSGTNGAVFNTDKYFVQNGVYQFDPTKLDEYHQKNWKEAKDAIQQGVKPIIIDNTNIFVAHMKSFVNLAVKNLYEIYFVEPETEWKKNPKECFRRNTHSVPEEKIAHMAECFEKISLTDIIRPTQLRIIPPLTDISDTDDAYNLFQTNLDYSLEYPDGLRKAYAKKQEVERLASSSSADSQCLLHGAIDLLKVSPNSLLEKDAIHSKKSSEQLFSLIPHQVPFFFKLRKKFQVPKKSLRTVGCQISDLIRVFDLSDSLPSVSDEFVWETIRDVDLSNEKKMRGKAIQAGDGKVLPDIELLLSFFPDEKPSDLSHILDIVGLNNAMTLFKEMNAHMDTCASNKNIDTEPLSRTYYWWDSAEFENIDDSSPVFVSNFEMNRAIPDKLAPCSYMQRCDPEPVPQGYYRMAISVDMMEQLTQLFVNDAFRSENFDFSSSVSSDEELARILQGHELASGEFLENGKHMNIAERLQLCALINDYSGVDRERITECFHDNRFSAEATRNTLELFVNGTERIPRTPADLSRIASPVNRSSIHVSSTVPRYITADGLSVLKPDIESAHKEVCELQEEADKYKKQKDEMLLRAKNHQEFGAKMFYFSEARKFGKKAKDCVAELNEILTKANTCSSFIDLHYMDVQSAIKLLKVKLNAADKKFLGPPELRRGRSGKKLVVLTGYGKLSDEQAKIKPAVVQWLEQCGYEYHNSSNKGELIVECK